jgi:hypothetical protein
LLTPNHPTVARYSKAAAIRTKPVIATQAKTLIVAAVIFKAIHLLLPLQAAAPTPAEAAEEIKASLSIIA